MKKHYKIQCEDVGKADKERGKGLTSHSATTKQTSCRLLLYGAIWNCVSASMKGKILLEATQKLCTTSFPLSLTNPLNSIGLSISLNYTVYSYIKYFLVAIYIYYNVG